MSYTSEKNHGNKTGMTAAIALNSAVVAAVLLAPMVVVPKPEPVITVGSNIPLDPPPPPDKQVKDRVADTQKFKKIFVPDAIFQTKISDPSQFITGDQITDTLIASGGLSDTVRDGIKIVEPPMPIFKAAVRDRRFASSFQPDFPTGLLQKEIEGTVKVKVLIGTDGRVRQVIILSATQSEFGRATERKALSSWRFTPATRDGEPVEDWQTLTVRFDIN
jgi:periplasmic protein TonB